jgi:hypothetical protein
VCVGFTTTVTEDDLVAEEAETVVKAGDACEEDVLIAVGLVVDDTVLEDVLVDRLVVEEEATIVDEIDEASLETEGETDGIRAASLNMPRIVLSCRTTPGPFSSQHIPYEPSSDSAW